MSLMTLSADVFLTLDRSKEQQQTGVNTRFKAEAEVLRVVMVVVLLMKDVGCGIISTEGSAAAIRAVVAADSWNNNIIKIFLRPMPGGPPKEGFISSTLMSFKEQCHKILSSIFCNTRAKPIRATVGMQKQTQKGGRGMWWCGRGGGGDGSGPKPAPAPADASLPYRSNHSY